MEEEFKEPKIKFDMKSRLRVRLADGSWITPKGDEFSLGSINNPVDIIEFEYIDTDRKMFR